MTHGGHSSTLIFPIPNAPLVDATGRITPAWYRFIVSLVQRTGGTGGRNTPLPAEPFQVPVVDFGEDATATTTSLTLVDGESAGKTLDDFLWAGMFPPQEPTPVIFGVDMGQDSGTAVTLFLPDLDGPALPEDITLGASPAAYAPGHDGFAVLSGGTVSDVSISRDSGATYYTTGEVTGAFPLSLSDTIRITYTVLPTLTFFRR